MLREVRFVCEGCGIGYACESDAHDCEKFCMFLEHLRDRGPSLIHVVQALEEFKTPQANEFMEAIQEYIDGYEEKVHDS